MMQFGSTLSAHNLNLSQARRASFSFKNYTSPLNPLTRTPSSCSYSAAASVSSQTISRKPSSISTEATRLHLSNLDKLLQTQPPPKTQLDPQPDLENYKDQNTGSVENKGKGLLEGLNLARLWPQVKAAEEMSPRHLNRLQRLLSKTGEYSPRNNLGTRWREYHGSNNWAGLLDPLDGNLRREVVRYGEFIQAAYHSFHSNPAMSAEEAQLPRHVALPDRSYKVTKSLYATSSIGLPDWVDDVAPDLGWMTQRSSWIGYVAVCDDKREISRMGRRDIVIAFRGTSTCLEWAENLRAQLIQMPSTEGGEQAQAKVECGFLSLYKTRGEHVPSLSESVVEEVKRLMEQYKGETLSITVTGHSLGAAIALLVGDELKTCAEEMPSVAVFSFGGPRVGNRGFTKRMDDKNVKVLRIVNSQDVITRVPGIFIGEGVLEEKLKSAKVGGFVDMIDRNMPLAYSHVGTELRVDTKMSPYLKPNADVACCHDLEAYLHLVDGFLASNCPFRENAKRSLVRLLQDQGSNVKKLYTSKANNLTRLKLEREGLQMASCLPSPSS
ncbi:phospholipase A1-Ibeta2 chloroplastic [Prunus yedoensis var. nudiflora]|uniref:Phospholipase A1-Ibeta2 chloroplastic n=1 Tax=Prunus yedoensis var. nudiflora TaxID=2094558 RepID=A0A314UTT5_PRUYE|nr:phospholipase A1-Ibeta2 chloroplastic [Prunus yedoensis var. nudiflora]